MVAGVAAGLARWLADYCGLVSPYKWLKLLSNELFPGILYLQYAKIRPLKRLNVNATDFEAVRPALGARISSVHAWGGLFSQKIDESRLGLHKIEGLLFWLRLTFQRPLKL